VDEASEKLRLQLEKGSLDTNLFFKILKHKNPKLENLLLDKSEITIDMLKHLKENGHNKKIKNKAKKELGKKLY
jgi:hypothetical protein